MTNDADDADDDGDDDDDVKCNDVDDVQGANDNEGSIGLFCRQQFIRMHSLIFFVIFNLKIKLFIYYDPSNFSQLYFHFLLASVKLN